MASTMRSGPTCRGSLVRMGMPVFTPGPTTRASMSNQRPAMAEYSVLRRGTTDDRATPDTDSRS